MRTSSSNLYAKGSDTWKKNWKILVKDGTGLGLTSSSVGEPPPPKILGTS